MKKKLIAIAIAVAVVAALVATMTFSPKITIDRKIIDDNAPKKASVAKYVDGDLALNEEEYTLVGKCGDNELYFKASDYTLKVKNVSTGNEWKSYIDEEDYIHNADKGNTENPLGIKNRLNRLFVIGYTNFAEITNTTAINEAYVVDTKLHKIENGLAVEAYFGDIGLGLTLEIWLDEDGLNVRVPRDKIKEEKQYGFLSATIMPMFGSTNDQVENGFLLLPDAGGGIYKIKPVEGRQNPITVDVYFPRDFDLDDIQENNQQGIKNATMPFFGVAKNQHGFVGYITEGEMNGYVTLNPSGTVYNVNRIESSVNYRKSFTYLNPAGKEVTETEKNISAEDFSIHYSFVSADEGKNVSYGDMATCLRNYLVNSGKLVKTEATKKAEVKTNLQMLMGAMTETMVAEYLQVMTSCDDILDMVNSLDDSVSSKLRLMLLGWQSTGYNIYPSSGKAASSIGSIKNLSKKLTEKGIESYLVDDLVYATTDSENFEKQSDAVYNEADLPITNSVGKQYVRNPYKEYKNLVENSIPYLKKNGTYGIGYDKIGWYVFDDAQDRVALNRLDSVSLYRGMLAQTHEAGIKTAVQRGNAYVLDLTDYLYDLAGKGSSYALLDADIPFYQMVVHGYIPYSLDTPGNMSIDYNTEKLKWIEKGAEPTFLLTQEMSEKFKDSMVENAFSTEISNWLDDVVEITKEFNTKLAFTGNCTMSDHEAVLADVYKVTYSNGNKVYVNYTSDKVTVDGVTVEAENYIVVNADGSIVK